MDVLPNVLIGKTNLKSVWENILYAYQNGFRLFFHNQQQHTQQKTSNNILILAGVFREFKELKSCAVNLSCLFQF